MTREEKAKKILEEYLALDSDMDSEYLQAQRVAIKALEAIDKIKAEVKSLKWNDYLSIGAFKKDVLMIIDKHIGESEVRNETDN